jgi:hypothetical protein
VRSGIIQEPPRFVEDSVPICSHKSQRSRFHALGSLGRLTYYQNRDAECWRFLLDTARIAEGERCAFH